MTKYVIKNAHNKAVMMPGGMLSPGFTRIIDLDEKLLKAFKDSDFLDIRKEQKNKVKKKAVKKGK